MVQIASTKKLKGVVTNTNPLADNANLTIGDNMVLNRAAMVGNRNGFDYWCSGLASQPDTIMEFSGVRLYHCKDNTLWATTALNTKSQFTGTYIPPTGQTMRGNEIRGNFYFTTSQGVYKATSTTSMPVQAGAPPALDLSLALSGTGGGWLSGNAEVAYRIAWQRTDANSMVVIGAPSQRAYLSSNNLVTLVSLTQTGGLATATVTSHTYSNGDQVTIANATPINYNGTYTISGVTSTTFQYTVAGSPTSPATGTITGQKYLNVAVSFTVPAEVIANDQYQIYRTASSASYTTSAGDTMYLVYAGTYSSGTTVSYTDTTTDSTLSTTPLYTNANVQGIANAAYRPPLCADIELYRDYAWYANTSEPAATFITQIGTSGFPVLIPANPPPLRTPASAANNQ